jgi:uncharacterized membrane protein YgcG
MYSSKRRPLRKWWLIPLILALLVPVDARAQSKTLHWERYDVGITVQQNGNLLIEEQQTIAFTSGSFHYGYRTIPTDKTDGIVDIEVWEGNRQYAQSASQSDYTFTVRQDGNELVVYWYFPYTSTSVHAFTFLYTVKGGVKINPQEGDSIFWKAIPPDHSFAIKSARVNVRFPAGVDVGDIVVYGAPAESAQEEDTVSFVALHEIPAGQEMEVGIAFGPGLITAQEPQWQSREAKAATLNLLLGALGALLLVGGLSALLLLWYLRGRDPAVGLAAEYLSEPPSDLPPGIAGTLVDERADMQDVTASLIDLARRGFLEMIETESRPGLLGLGSGSEFTFRRTDRAWDDLLPFERTILKKVFGKRAERPLADLKNHFYTAIPKIKKGLYQQTVKYKFFRTDPDTVRSRYAGLGYALLVLTGGIGFLLYVMVADTIGAIICPFVSIGIAAIAVIIIGQAMPAKTRKGAEEAAKWKAFKRYLRDIDRYTRLEEASEQFDRYLPYAVAFGIERSWINKFAAVPTTPVPLWYYPVWMGPGRARHSSPSSAGRQAPSLDGMSKGMTTGLAGMSAGLTSMLNTAGSTLTSRPQSSGGGSGSWGGGGFSGGGGGGGGSAGFG